MLNTTLTNGTGSPPTLNSQGTGNSSIPFDLSAGPGASSSMRTGAGDPMGNFFAAIFEGFNQVGEGAHSLGIPTMPEAIHHAVSTIADTMVAVSDASRAPQAWDEFEDNLWEMALDRHIDTARLVAPVHPAGSYWGLPGASAASFADRPAHPLGREKILLVTDEPVPHALYNRTGDVRDGSIPMDRIAGHLRDQFGAENVQVVARKPEDAGKRRGWFYPRNLAAAAPNGMLVTAKAASDSVDHNDMLDILEGHLRDHNVRFARMGRYVNFANVEYMANAAGPGEDLLLVAASKSHSMPAGGPVLKELRQHYAAPEHVIHYELNFDLPHPLLGSRAQPRCYDADLACHLTTNAKGESVILVHWPCIKANPVLAPHGKREVKAMLERMGIKIISVGAQDQANLVTNSIEGPEPGQILLSSHKVTPELLEEMRRNGLEPILPPADVAELGATESIAPFGLHCLTLHIHGLPDPRPWASAMYQAMGSWLQGWMGWIGGLMKKLPKADL